MNFALRLDELHYDLPAELIAQQPAARRDASRLLVMDRTGGTLGHHDFSELGRLLPAGTLLVLNDTRVLPARIYLRRASGGRLEGLFLHEAEPGEWELMLTHSGRIKPGERLAIEGSSHELRLGERVEAGVWRARPEPAGEAEAILQACGVVPLPPYIARSREESPERRAADAERYQTVYARQAGAVAAPTAGLHFTETLLAELRAGGIETVHVTLHVGVGTFQPIRAADLADHDMHAEWYDCPAATADAVNRARSAGRPVVAVGTTSVRVLESCATPSGIVEPGSGWTRLFIYPPYDFRAVDGMVTNFHLPGSTLLAMLFAFAGRENILEAYAEAIRARYRFYSYGDAMLIVPGVMP